MGCSGAGAGITRLVCVVLVSELLGVGGGVAAELYCEQNPVAFCNDFETGSWDGMENEPDAYLVTDGVPGFDTFRGGGSVKAVLDSDGDGAAFGYRFPGLEQVYVRFYMKWEWTWDRPMHHFFAIHGDRDGDMWSCHGTAGCRPNGTLCLNGATVDTRQEVAGELPGEPFFYSYFPDMNCDPGDICADYADPVAICQGCAARGLPCEDGLECCWGNHFNLNQGIPVFMQQERWYAVETMIKANSVFLDAGVPDGEMALWIDGVLVAHHSGMLWRHTEDLLLNHFIVWNYFPEASQAYRIWFDNLVISASPIGALGSGVFDDDFESSDTSAWSETLP